jgi:hypothetical protein
MRDLLELLTASATCVRKDYHYGNAAGLIQTAIREVMAAEPPHAEAEPGHCIYCYTELDPHAAPWECPNKNCPGDPRTAKDTLGAPEV